MTNITELQSLPTFENLKTSLAFEARAVLRFLYFAKIAEIEGLHGVAQLFEEMAEGGICCSHGTLDLLRHVGDPDSDIPIGETNSNLRSALQVEMQAFEAIYPAMAATAREDRYPDIASWFETLAKLKRSHVETLRKTLEAMRQPSGGEEQ